MPGMTTPVPMGRQPNELRPMSFERDFTGDGRGIVPRQLRRTRACCARPRSTRTSALDEGDGQGLGHRRVLDAPGLVARARSTREVKDGKPSGRTHGDPAPHRPGPAVGVRHARCSASARSSSTATCSRPTAAPARRRSAAATSRCTTRCAGWCRPGLIAAAPAHGVLRGDLASASSTASPVLDLPYVEDSTRRGRHERGDDLARGRSSRCRAPPRGGPYSRASSTPCSCWPRAASRRSSPCSRRWSPCCRPAPHR